MQTSIIDEMKRESQKALNRKLPWSLGFTDCEIALHGTGIPNSWNDTVPGHPPHWMRMKAACCNIFAITMSGGARIPGFLGGRDSLPIEIFENVGTLASGSMSEKEQVTPEYAAGGI